MSKYIALTRVCCVFFLGGLDGCSPKPVPLKEGVIYKVVWSSAPGSQIALYRDNKMPERPLAGQGGEYGVDMFGVLHPGFLEVRRVGARDAHCYLIPANQISWLEFGDGGIVMEPRRR